MPSSGGTPTRRRVIRAALETLTEAGFAATTARAIARTGGFAPGVIYYHFANIEDLLLAALDQTTGERLAAYRAALDGVRRPDELVARLRDLYAEDLAAGHIAAVQELVAGASSSPELGRRVAERVRPWVDLAEETVSAVLGGTALESLMPARDVAFAAISLYLGMETLSHLDGDRERAESLFSALERLMPLLQMALAAGAPGADAERDR